MPKDSTPAIDRAYIDYAQFQRFTDEGVCYVTKMKKNLKYRVISTVNYVNQKGVIVAREQMIVFEKGDLRHESRKVDILDDNGKIITLLTNNIEFSVEDLREIYRRRWAIETLYKQLKQNFQLHFFFGDSVNAIETQTWIVLDCQHVTVRYSEQNKTPLFFFANRNNGAPNADVLHRLCRFYGKSEPRVANNTGRIRQIAP